MATRCSNTKTLSVCQVPTFTHANPRNPYVLQFLMSIYIELMLHTKKRSRSENTRTHSGMGKHRMHAIGMWVKIGYSQKWSETFYCHTWTNTVTHGSIFWPIHTILINTLLKTPLAKIILRAVEEKSHMSHIKKHKATQGSLNPFTEQGNLHLSTSFNSRTILQPSSINPSLKPNTRFLGSKVPAFRSRSGCWALEEMTHHPDPPNSHWCWE